MKAAYEKGFDWIWVTDDDVVFDRRSVEVMLKYKGISKFIHLSKYEDSGQKYSWELEFKPEKLTYIDVKNKPDAPYYFTNTACFEGALIHKSIITKIGFPDSRFFIFGDDTIYGYLASKNFKIICIREYLIHKLLKKQKESPFTLYFRIRNTLLIYRCLKENGVRISKIKALYIFTWTAIRAFLKAVLILGFSRQHINKLIDGFYDGLKGNFGVPKWLRPNDEN